MRPLPLFAFLPFAISAHFQNPESNNYVVVLNQPSLSLPDLVSDVVTQVLSTVPYVKPKRKYKNGRVRGFSAVLSSAQLSSLRANPKVCFSGLV